MLESKLYLIFEYLPMDLKRYMESLGDDNPLSPAMVKSLTYQVRFYVAELVGSSRANFHNSISNVKFLAFGSNSILPSTTCSPS